MVKLSIIIPYYNTPKYTEKLLEELEKQITDEVEVLIIDDFSNEKLKIDYEKKWLRYFRLNKNSNGASKPRNIGLDNAKGEYIAFIDSDDLVSPYYIRHILKAIEEKPDIIFLSWKNKMKEYIIYIQPSKWNCAVWCRVYKKEIIGNTRFDEDLRIAEDWKFNEQIKYDKKVCIKNVVYYYNNGRKGSILNG